MRTLLFAAAALTISGAAIAQDASQTTTTTEQPSGETVDDPSQATGPEGITQQGTDPNGEAAAPAGTNQGMQGDAGTGMAAQPMSGQQAAFTPRPATTEYPACSRTVTDSCVQTYERGVRRSRRR
jgi:translation initiation factor IF-2/pilus assembly protein FimV